MKRIFTRRKSAPLSTLALARAATRRRLGPDPRAVATGLPPRGADWHEHRDHVPPLQLQLGAPRARPLVLAVLPEHRCNGVMTCKGRKRNVLIVGAALLLVYAASLFQMPRHVFWSPDEGTNYLAARSVRFGNGLDYSTVYGGKAIDPGLKFLPLPGLYPHPSITSKGEIDLRFGMAVGFVLVSRYMMEAFGTSGLYLVPMLSGWLVALLSGRIAWLIDRRLAIPATLLVGLGTPIFFYSLVFWEHAPATLCGLVLAWLMIESPFGLGVRLAAGLPFIITAVILRMEMAAYALAVLASGALSHWLPQRPGDKRGARNWGSRLSPWAAFPLLACVAVAFAYLFAALLSERHRRLLTLIPERIGTIPARLHEIPTSLVDVLVGSSTSQGPTIADGWAIAAAVAVGATLVAACARRVWMEAALILPALLLINTVTLTVALSPEEYRAMHGLFLVTPFAVLWPYALRGAWRRRDRHGGTLGCLAMFYLLFGFTAIFLTYVDNGRLAVSLEWGQRYLLTVYPILTVLGLVAVRDYWESGRPVWLRSAVCSIALVLALLSVGMEARGLSMLGKTRRTLATWEHALQGHNPIVTDRWWLPGALAPMYEHHPMFYVPTWRNLVEWMPLAEAQGIRQFTFAGSTAGEEGYVGSYLVRRVSQEPQVGKGLILSRFEFARDPATTRTGASP
jgi:hypothetical protein